MIGNNWQQFWLKIVGEVIYEPLRSSVSDTQTLGRLVVGAKKAIFGLAGGGQNSKQWNSHINRVINITSEDDDFKYVCLWQDKEDNNVDMIRLVSMAQMEQANALPWVIGTCMHHAIWGGGLIENGPEIEPVALKWQAWVEILYGHIPLEWIGKAHCWTNIWNNWHARARSKFMNEWWSTWLQYITTSVCIWWSIRTRHTHTCGMR